jgi:hypothetical protein
MDVDGSWIDSNNDDIYETHTAGSGDMGPELYVSRLFTTTLDWANEETLLVDYFNKIHQYNTGNLTVPWRGLEYIDEDWYNMDVYLNTIFDDDVSHYDFGYETTGKNYLLNIEKGHHFVTVCAHSYSGGHHFGKRPTEAVTYAHIYVYSPIQREAKIVLGSDDGIMAWFNGEKILQKNIYQGWIVDRYKVDVTLEEGWNRLLCKISQESGDHQLSVRFTDTELNTLTDLKYQINNPEEFDSGGEFIRSWLVNGFHQDSSDSFYQYLNTNYLNVDESGITPSEGQSMGGKKWETYDSSGPYIDLDEYSGSQDFGVTYAYVSFHADKESSCELWTGYDDGMKAWLNGKEILFDNRYGDYLLDMTKIPVQLHQGENHLLVKVSEWMGNHGFTARFCTSLGEEIEGLSYNPQPEPISYIGNWLVAGPFSNDNTQLRLTTEYIPNEASLSPSIGENASKYVWSQAIGNGCPLDLNDFFDKGDWVYSNDIQSLDPPVLFYNLFACSAGRFTDENYLSGSYVFNTSFGLVSLASSKSGSMLNFQDFSIPLSQGKTIGESFLEWFNTQAPFAQWEKEWFYGMTLCGDPTLTITPTDEPQLSIEIISPTNGIYAKDTRILPFFAPVVFGDVTVKIDVINQGYGIEKVWFYVDDKLLFTDDQAPFECRFNQTVFGKQVIQVIAQDSMEKTKSESLTIWKFF